MFKNWETNKQKILEENYNVKDDNTDRIKGKLNFAEKKVINLKMEG